MVIFCICMPQIQLWSPWTQFIILHLYITCDDFSTSLWAVWSQRLRVGWPSLSVRHNNYWVIYNVVIRPLMLFYLLISLWWCLIMQALIVHAQVIGHCRCWLFLLNFESPVSCTMHQQPGLQNVLQLTSFLTKGQYHFLNFILFYIQLLLFCSDFILSTVEQA